MVFFFLEQDPRANLAEKNCCWHLIYSKRVLGIPFSETLTHFCPVFLFYTPWKSQKTKGFLTFSGGIEMKHIRLKWVNNCIASFYIFVLISIASLISSFHCFYHYFSIYTLEFQLELNHWCYKSYNYNMNNA